MTAPYRVLHVIDHLGSGGAQEVVGQLLRYGNRRLFQPEVAALHGSGHYFDLFRSWGYRVYTLAPQDYALPAVPLIAFRLWRLLARGGYDLVHTHLQAANLLAPPLAAWCRVPVRLLHDHVHDDARYRHPLLRWLDRLTSRLSHHILAGSASIRDFLCRVEKIPVEKISVIYCGVDLEQFSPADPSAAGEGRRHRRELPSGALVVGGVGRLHYQKNFPLFLRVAAEVSRQFPQAHFLIAGEGPDRAALEDLARNLGIAAKVHFQGFVKDMREFYRSLDLLLFPTRFEGTCLTTLEALALGVPVVASRVDGIAELLEDGEDAILVPFDHQQGFVAGACRLLADRHLARRLARAGQDKVRRHFSAQAMVRRVESLYLSRLKDRLTRVILERDGGVGV